jgi:hypothetical protein
MEAGLGRTLEAVDSNILTIATSLPLGHFAAARKPPPTRVFDF